MSKLSGKTALVTGASKGIGAGIAKELARAGAAVVVNYSSSKESADAVVAEITGAAGKAIALPSDMSKAVEVQRLLAESQKAFGRPILASDDSAWITGEIIRSAGGRI